jgi:hypothetical protein
MKKLMTTTVLDKILDGKIQISDLDLSVDEQIQLGKELEQRKATREENGVVDNRVFLQEVGSEFDINCKDTNSRMLTEN